MYGTDENNINIVLYLSLVNIRTTEETSPKLSQLCTTVVLCISSKGNPPITNSTQRMIHKHSGS